MRNWQSLATPIFFCLLLALFTSSTNAAPDHIIRGNFTDGLCQLQAVDDNGTSWLVDIRTWNIGHNQHAYLLEHLSIRNTPHGDETYITDVSFGMGWANELEEGGGEWLETTPIVGFKEFYTYLPALTGIRPEIAPYWIVPNAIESKVWNSSNSFIKLRVLTENHDGFDLSTNEVGLRFDFKCRRTH